MTNCTASTNETHNTSQRRIPNKETDFSSEATAKKTTHRTTPRHCSLVSSQLAIKRSQGRKVTLLARDVTLRRGSASAESWSPRRCSVWAAFRCLRTSCARTAPWRQSPSASPVASGSAREAGWPRVVWTHCKPANGGNWEFTGSQSEEIYFEDKSWK